MINIETLLLVAIWEKPFIFQGCFKISTTGLEHKKFFFFRYECDELTQTNLVENEFFPANYRLTHFYNEIQPILLDEIPNQAVEDAFYILKYALFTTVKEMLLQQAPKHHLSIDEVVIDTLFEKIKPMMEQESSWKNSMSEIGFAVAMDFSPQEPMGEAAVNVLLNNFGNIESIH